VTAVGVAAIATLQMIGRGKDEVRAFVVEVFRAEFFAWRVTLLFSGWVGWLRHRFVVFSLFTPLQVGLCFYPGVPPPPSGVYLEVKYFDSIAYS
jgi:hypothetical protein